MIYKCENQDINRIVLSGEEVMNLNKDWYVDIVCYSNESPYDWFDILIKKKEEPTNENEDIC